MKQIQIKGNVIVPNESTACDFMDELINWVESKGYEFNGGVSEIVNVSNITETE